MNEPELDSETALWVAISKAQRVIFSATNSEFKQNQLPSLHWYDVLWSIERRGGSLRPFELEKELIFEQSNLSHLVQRIEKKGFIHVAKLTGDRRGRVLHITKEGIRTRKAMWEIYGRILHDKLGALNEFRDREPLVSALIELS